MIGSLLLMFTSCYYGYEIDLCKSQPSKKTIVFTVTTELRGSLPDDVLLTLTPSGKIRDIKGNHVNEMRIKDTLNEKINPGDPEDLRFVVNVASPKETKASEIQSLIEIMRKHNPKTRSVIVIFHLHSE